MILGRSIALAVIVLAAAYAVSPAQALTGSRSGVTSAAREMPRMMSRERRAALRRAWRRSHAPVLHLTRVLMPTASIFSRPYMVIGL
jgi:hypothetical protein